MFESLTDKSKFDAQPELFIHIIPGKTRNLLTLIDSGIGMTKSDLVQRVAINDIEDFEAKYEGTDSEKKNLKDLYTKFKGNMNRDASFLFRKREVEVWKNHDLMCC